MSIELILIITLNIALIGLIGLFLYKKFQQFGLGKDQDGQRELMKNLINEVYGEITQKVSEQSRGILKQEQQLIESNLKSRQEQIEKVISELRRELSSRQDEIRKLEGERNKQFSMVSTHIREHQNITKELQLSTERLNKVLQNNQKRGEWGEYILDDILRTAGLVEGVHYVKQQVLGKSLVKPDITLLLPNDRRVAVDAKFPFSAIQKMVETESKLEKDKYRREFINDVKSKVKDLSQKGYINPEEGTLDYTILFVPNEMLFSYINQEAPAVIELAMKSRVAIVSPFTFLVVARTIMESYRNFMIENNLRDIIKYISDFVTEWERFEGEFSDFDRQLLKLRQVYDKISGTRFNRMRLRINRIEEYRHGMLETAEVQKLEEGKTN